MLHFEPTRIRKFVLAKEKYRDQQGLPHQLITFGWNRNVAVLTQYIISETPTLVGSLTSEGHERLQRRSNRMSLLSQWRTEVVWRQETWQPATSTQSERLLILAKHVSTRKATWFICGFEASALIRIRYTVNTKYCGVSELNMVQLVTSFLYSFLYLSSKKKRILFQNILYKKYTRESSNIFVS
jgi:hypothetical protein